MIGFFFVSVYKLNLINSGNNALIINIDVLFDMSKFYCNIREIRIHCCIDEPIGRVYTHSEF